MREENRIQDRPRRFTESKADVRDAQHRQCAGQLLFDEPDALDGVDRAALVLLVAGRQRERQNVEQQLPRLKAVFQGPLIDPLRDLQLPLARERHALLVDGHRDGAGAVLLQERKHLVDLVPAALEVNAVHDADAG